MSRPLTKVLLILLLTSGTLDAQQIDTSWFYKEGFTVDHIFNYHPNSADPGPEGEDNIWDFSHATPDSTFDVITERYVDCELTRFGDTIPEANICLINETKFFGLESYFTQTDDEIRLVADATDSSSEPNPLNSIIMTDGFSLGDTLWNHSDEYYIFDGTGTVITPVDTFENCVRIFHKKLNSTTYSWYQGSLMKQIISMHPPYYIQGVLDDGFIIYMEDFSFDNTSVVQELKDSGKKAVSANLQNDRLILTNNERPLNIGCSIYDLQGRRLYNLNSKNLALGENHIHLPKLNYTNPRPVIIVIQDHDSPEFWTDQLIAW